MSRLPAWQEYLDFFGRPVLLGPSQGHHSGDAGLVPVRQLDERIGLTQAFAETLTTPVTPPLPGTAF